MTIAKELALGGMFTALGVVLLCLGGVVPLALYACPILASAVLLPVRERCSKRVAWNCYAAIAILGTLLGPDKEASMLFVFLGYYPLIKPKFDTICSRALRLSAKLLLAIFAVGADYLILLFVLRLDVVTQELAETAPAILWATCAGTGAVSPVRSDAVPSDSSVPAQTAVTPTLTTRCMAGGGLGTVDFCSFSA